MWLSMVDEAVGGEVKQSGEGKGSKKWMEPKSLKIYSKFEIYFHFQFPFFRGFR